MWQSILPTVTRFTSLTIAPLILCFDERVHCGSFFLILNVSVDTMTSLTTLTEVFNHRALKQLISNPELVYQRASKKADAMTGPELLKQLKLYQSNATGKQVQVSYAYGRNSTSGRWYAKGPSLQHFPRGIRSILAPNKLYDYDMANANPTLLQQICTELNIPCPVLSSYVEDREDRLSALPLERSEAKDAVIAVMFGANVYSNLKGTWLTSFHKECRSIADELTKHHPDIWKALKSRENARGKFLSRVILEAESECLVAMKEYASKHSTVRVLLFDGLMVDNTLDCVNMSAFVKEKTGYSVQIMEKPFARETVDDLLKQYEIKPKDGKYLQDGILLDIRYKFISLCAGMCMGKTEQTMLLVEKYRQAHKSVLFITQRISMASSSFERLQHEGLKFFHYQDEPGMITQDAVICEYESLSRLGQTYDLIVMDEFRSICETIQSPTNGLKVLQHWEHLKDLTSRAEKVLFLCADMEFDSCAYEVQDMLARNDAQVASTVYTQEALRLAREYPEKVAERERLIIEAHNAAHTPVHVHRIVDRTQKMKRSIQLSGSVAMLAQAAKLLRKGKRIALCCASIKAANMYSLYLSDASQSIGLYTSMTDNKEDVKTLQACWDKYQCIIFTSTITTGADYCTPIDSVFLFPYHNACTPRDMSQMAGRLRTVVTGDIYVAVDDKIDMTRLQAYTRAQVDSVYKSELDRLQECSTTLGDVLQNSALALRFTLDPKTLARVYQKTPSEMLIIGAYSSAERSFTRSNKKWLELFLYMCKNKGYAIETGHIELKESMKWEILKFLKSTSDSINAADDAHMASIDVEGFRTDNKGFLQLRHLASGLHLENGEMDDFSTRYPGLKEDAVTLAAAVRKATVARTFNTLPIEKITPSFVTEATENKRPLQLHDIHQHLGIDAARLTDFLLTMQHSKVPELRSAHILPTYMYVNQLVQAMGADGIHDTTTTITEDSEGFKPFAVARALAALNHLGVYVKDASEPMFKEACRVLKNAAGLKIGPEKTLEHTKAMRSLVKDLPPHNAEWFNAKWCIEPPEKDQYKPTHLNTVTDLQKLLAVYEEHEGQLFDVVREEINTRIRVVATEQSTKRSRCGDLDWEKYVSKRAKIAV